MLFNIMSSNNCNKGDKDFEVGKLTIIIFAKKTKKFSRKLTFDIELSKQKDFFEDLIYKVSPREQIDFF